MKKFKTACVAVVSLVATNVVFADELCLIGTWTAVEETAAVKDNDSSTQNGGLVQTVAVVSGSVSIEIVQDGTVRITYEDYTAALTSTMSGRSRTVRGVYSGTAQGNLTGQGDKLALSRFSEVDFEAMIRMPDGTFVSAESGVRRPPHEESDYVFECDDSELLLTAAVHSFFGDAEYRGRFSRSN